MDTQFSEAKKHSYYINMGIKTFMEVNFSKVQTYIFYTRTNQTNNGLINVLSVGTSWSTP